MIGGNQMSSLETMQLYFRGEKLEAMFFILPTGLMLIGFGAVALKTERGGFAWGIAVPTILFGLILAGTGIGVATRSNGQVAQLTAEYREAPAEMARTELPRMQTVNTNFRLTFYAFGALASVGLALHYLIGAGWARGLGAVLLPIGALGLLIDGFAERRAVPHTKALESIAAQQGAHKPRR